MIRLAELEGPDKDLLLIFLYELQRRGMIWSRLELSEDEKRTERVWYGYQMDKNETVVIEPLKCKCGKELRIAVETASRGLPRTYYLPCECEEE